MGLTAGETLRSKTKFELMLDDTGVTVKRYHADNAPFNATAFREHLSARDQKIDFSGVGAHHQNGIAERAIQTVTKLARTMLLYAILLWPDQADIALWPFAMDHAVYIWNNLPRSDTRLTPNELLTKIRQTDYSNLHRLYVWGCPDYVLDPRLQDGKKIP